MPFFFSTSILCPNIFLPLYNSRPLAFPFYSAYSPDSVSKDFFKSSVLKVIFRLFFRLGSIYFTTDLLGFGVEESFVSTTFYSFKKPFYFSLLPYY